MYEYDNKTVNKLLLYLLFTQSATEKASEYLAANHDKMEDIDGRPCSITVDVLLKVSFDIVVFDLRSKTQSCLEREIVCSASNENIPRIYKFDAKHLLIKKTSRIYKS